MTNSIELKEPLSWEELSSLAAKEFDIINGLSLSIYFSASKTVHAAPSVNLSIGIILQFGAKIFNKLFYFYVGYFLLFLKL